MLYQVKSTLHLDIKLALGLVNSGGPKNAPAWVEMPSLMPLVGTPAFRALTVPVYIRKSFIEESLFEQVVLAMAHELCHVVLNATSHPLRQQEEAVDLTAMLLGFRDFYVTGCQRRVEMYVPHPHEAVWEKRHITYSHGYLTIEEVGYAAEYMTYR